MRVLTQITHPESDATLGIDCDYEPGRAARGASAESAGGDPAEPDTFDMTVFMEDDPEKQDISALLPREVMDRVKDAVREQYAQDNDPDPDAERDAREDR